MNWFSESLIQLSIDVAGVFAFFLSLALALSQIISNKLRVSASNYVFITTDKAPDSIFLFLILSNKTKVPFSLIDIYIDVGKDAAPINIEESVRTYHGSDPKNKLTVERVVLSPAFPVKLDSYASVPLLLEVHRQNIDIQFLLQETPAHNLVERLRRRFPRIHRQYTHQPRPLLMLNTSRGRRAAPILDVSRQEWEWLKKYAVRKGIHEGKTKMRKSYQ